jgi:hypothetical protein
MEKKTMKDWIGGWVKDMEDASLQVRAVIREIGGHVKAAAELNAEIDKVRFASLTAWVRELRKDDMLDEASAAQVVCTWIKQSSADSAARMSAIGTALTAVTDALAPLAQAALPLLMQMHPGWFQGEGGKEN